MASTSNRTMTNEDLELPYNITFTTEVQRYNISVHDEFLELTRAKLKLTRFVREPFSDPAAEDGTESLSARRIVEYWVNDYNWRKVEASINSALQQYSCIVQPTPSPAQYEHSVPLHFIHHRSARPDAIPLIFNHGWPGSFLEVAPIIDALTDPPDASLPAFHIVAPSIPGYGFSPPPQHPGFGYRAAAATFHALMTEKLGYRRYCFQGGDAGDLINRYMAHDFSSSVIAGHSNFWVVPVPPPTHPFFTDEQESEDAVAAKAGLDGFFEKGWAYAQIQQTRPLKFAHGLTDSPVGLAMWIYTSVVAGIEPERAAEVWTLERVVTWTMMHWLNGAYGAISLYRWGAEDGAISTKQINLLPYVSQPVGISQFPYDIGYRTPLSWAKQAGNVVGRKVHEKGGHFPALTDTEALLGDVWEFFGSEEVATLIGRE